MGILMDGITYLPVVMPMGWSWSCWVAQAVTWGVILKEQAGDEHLGVPQHLPDSPPGSVEMSDGTTIIVILDTILVIGTESSTKKWKSRIERNMAEAQLMLKYSELSRAVEFAGMRITNDDDGTKWSVREETVTQWKKWEDERRIEGLASMTPLTLWKAAGFLRFAAPVVGMRLFELGRVGAAQSKVSKSYSLKRRCDYTVVLECLREPIEYALNLIWTVKYDEERHGKSHLKGLDLRKYCIVATDATLELEAYSVMSTPEVRRSRKGTTGVDIQIAEGNAIAWCLDDLEAEVPADQVIIIVGDNQPDIRSFHRGWSGHEGARFRHT